MGGVDIIAAAEGEYLCHRIAWNRSRIAEYHARQPSRQKAKKADEYGHIAVLRVRSLHISQTRRVINQPIQQIDRSRYQGDASDHKQGVPRRADRQKYFRQSPKFHGQGNIDIQGDNAPDHQPFHAAPTREIAQIQKDQEQPNEDQNDHREGNMGCKHVLQKAPGGILVILRKNPLGLSKVEYDRHGSRGGNGGEQGYEQIEDTGFILFGAFCRSLEQSHMQYSLAAECAINGNGSIPGSLRPAHEARRRESLKEGLNSYPILS